MIELNNKDCELIAEGIVNTREYAGVYDYRKVIINEDNEEEEVIINVPFALDLETDYSFGEYSVNSCNAYIENITEYLSSEEVEADTNYIESLIEDKLLS